MSEPNSRLSLEVIPDLYFDQNRASTMARLYLQSENEGFDGTPGCPPTDEEVAEKALGMLGESFVVATDVSDEVLSMGGLRRIAGGSEGLILDVATLPEHRGKGIGTSVLRELIDLAMRYGLTRLYVYPAQGSGSFYKKLGFERGHDRAPNKSWAVKDLR